MQLGRLQSGWLSVRIGEMQDCFEANVELFEQVQRKIDKYVQDFERRASKQPFLCAEEAWIRTRSYLEVLRQQSIDPYGLDVGRYGPIIIGELLEPAEEEPDCLENITPLYGSSGAITVGVFLVSEYELWNLTLQGMWSAYRRPDIWGVRVAECVCELYALALREEVRSGFAAMETVQKRFPRVARRQALAEALTGYFVSQLTSARKYRMGRSLFSEKSPEESIDQALLRELPAEALSAWAQRGHEDLKELRNQIAGRLELLGRESSFKENLADLPAGMPEKGEEDVLLEEFERQETLRQEVEQLKEWAESARLSGREAQMYEADMRTNFDTAAAAQEMGVSDKKARDYRSRYLAKLKQAAGL
jgi:hypothetical protein